MIYEELIGPVLGEAVANARLYYLDDLLKGADR